MSNLPKRHPPVAPLGFQVLTENAELVFQQLPNQSAAWPKYRCLFKHQDGRVWQALIEPQQTQLNENPDWLVTLTTPGCREYRFFGPTAAKMRNVTNYFAKLPKPLYSRLVADARPTQTHNNLGCAVVILAMPLSAVSKNKDLEPLTFLGQLNDDSSVTLYPSNEELTKLLFEIADACGVIPVLEQTLQEVSVENVRERLQQTAIYSTLESVTKDLSSNLFAAKPARRVVSL